MWKSEALKADLLLLGADSPSPTFVFFLSLQHCVFTLCQASKDIRRFLNHTHTRSESHLFHLTSISTHARANTNAWTKGTNPAKASPATHPRTRTYWTIKHMCRITLKVQIYSGVCFSHLLKWSLLYKERRGFEEQNEWFYVPGSKSDCKTELEGLVKYRQGEGKRPGGKKDVSVRR